MYQHFKKILWQFFYRLVVLLGWIFFFRKIRYYVCICTSTHFFWISNSPKQPTFRLLGQTNTIFILYSVKTFFPGKVTCNTFSKKYFINAQTEKEANDLTGKNSIYICVPLTIWTKSVICEHRISLLDNAPRYLVVCIIQKRFLHKFHYFSIFKLSVLCIPKNRTWFT